MKHSLQSNSIRSADIAAAAWRILLGLMLVAGTAASVHAQGQIASGTISGSGSGPYTYSLSFRDAASSTSPIGSVWYGWTASGAISCLEFQRALRRRQDGWRPSVAVPCSLLATSPANDITVGGSLSGFGYQATFSPAQLAAAPNSGLSDAYSAGLFSDAGDPFTVTAVVPEPSALALLLCGAIGLCWAGRRRLRVA